MNQKNVRYEIKKCGPKNNVRLGLKILKKKKMLNAIINKKKNSER